MNRPVESEIKLHWPGPDAARSAVVALGARLVTPRHLEDNFVFDTPELSLRNQGRLVRLRHAPHGGVLTYKGPREIVDGIKSREEVETVVEDVGAARKILEGLGLAPVFRYQKYREVYHWRDVEIVVDETPIGTFLEIEGDVDAIHAAAAALGKGPEDYVNDSYAALFFAAGGKGDMVFG